MVGLGFSQPLLGQNRSIRFDHLSADDGLSQGTVICVLQDRQGFMWFGTQEGLNRYDGYSFQVYRKNPDDPLSLSNDWIQALEQSRDGDLWIGTQGGGLNRWNRQRDAFSHYRFEAAESKSLPSDRIRVLLEDRQGVLWVGTEESGLARLGDGETDFERFRSDPDAPESLVSDEIRALYEDRKGILWVGTLGGLDHYDSASGAFVHHPPSKTSANTQSIKIRSIEGDGKDLLWVGTDEGILTFDLGRRAFSTDSSGNFAVLSKDRVRSLHLADRNRLWIGTDAGLYAWDRELRELVGFRHLASDPTSLPADQVMTIFEDRGEILWVGTLGGGVARWNPRTWPFALYRGDLSNPKSPGNNIFAFTEDQQGQLWVGSLGGGLSRLDRQRDHVKHFQHDPDDPRSLPGDGVTALATDGAGNVWVGTVSQGLSRYDSATERFRTYYNNPRDPLSLSGNAVTAILPTREGILWVGTHGHGLNRLDPKSEVFERFQHDAEDSTSLSNDRVMSLAEDSEGRLWIATDGGGLSRFDGRDFRNFLHQSDDPGSLSGDNLTVVHVDGKDQLFVGTQGRGLVRLVAINEETGRATFNRVTARDGLPSDTIWGIDSDSKGWLWISTNRGLSHWDPEDGEIKNYDTSHGLQSSEFNLGAHYRSPSGELFFGGVNGFNAFFPEEIEENTYVPPVVLTSFSVLNEPRTFDRPLTEVDSIILDHRDDFFSFEVAALDFTAPHKNRYRYRLEGFRDGWVDHENRRRIDFTSLDPGEYTLRVLGSNNDGVWNQEGLTIALTITPPFWHAWWFRIAGVWALASLILVVFRVRTRAIRRNNEKLRLLVEERTHDLEEVQERLLRKERLAVLGELAGSVAHEIRNPLGVIRNSSYFLKLTQRGKIDAKGYEHLELIEREVDQTNRIIAEMLDYARDRPAQTRPMEVRSAIGRALELVQIPDEVHLERQCAVGSPRVEADPDQVERLLANLIQNAVQAMPEGGRLEVGCQGVGEQVVIHVRDQGVGIPEGDLEKIFEPLFTTKANGIGLGLALCQRYALLNGGRLECESQLGEGTEFRLLLPRIPDPEKGEDATDPQADPRAEGPEEARKSQTKEAIHG